MLAMPTPALAVPYAAPRSARGGQGQAGDTRGQRAKRRRGGRAARRRPAALPRKQGAGAANDALANTNAAATPMKPKKAAEEGHSGLSIWEAKRRGRGEAAVGARRHRGGPKRSQSAVVGGRGQRGRRRGRAPRREPRRDTSGRRGSLSHHLERERHLSARGEETGEEWVRGRAGSNLMRKRPPSLRQARTRGGRAGGRVMKLCTWEGAKRL